MRHALLQTIAIIVAGIALAPTPSSGEVRLVRQEQDKNELAIVSDGPMPWRIRYRSVAAASSPSAESKLVPVNAERSLFVHGLVLHLIDTKNGVVTARWIFPDAIRDVRVEGDRFHVQTVHFQDYTINETVTITADSPSPPRWIDSLLHYRRATAEGSWCDKTARLEPDYEAKTGRPLSRKPLESEDARRLIPELEDAVRRDPFSPQLGVCLALLLRDLERQDAEAVFLRAIDRPSNSYGELFMIAQNLENGGNAAWATQAFDLAYARLWQQGVDPRLIHLLLPRLMLLYHPYDLRLEIPDERRLAIVERVYRLGPYVQHSSVGWQRLAEYLEGRGDAKNAALWTSRAREAETKSGFVWELVFYLERTMRVLVALVFSVLAYYVVLQIRYAPQRRLMRGVGNGWRGLLRVSPFSMTCWDRQDRRILYGLLALVWLATGLFGSSGDAAFRGYLAPIAASSGTLRAPSTQKYLRGLPSTVDRDLLLALSLQQAEKDVDAEALYRTLPDSAVKFNNLGVLQAKQGKADEARTSFDQALRLNPGVVEAAFNLGRPVSDPWATMHATYLPGQKMLALPTHEVFYRATRGSLGTLAWRSLGGPLVAVSTLEALAFEIVPLPRTWPRRVVLWIFGGVFFALGLLALRTPYREVTQAPPRWHFWLETVLPGTAREWGRAGGLVLAIVIWGILELVSVGAEWMNFDIGISPYRAFGLPPSVGTDVGVIWPSDPGWFWNHGSVVLAGLIIVANVILVLRSRRLRRSAS